MKKLNVLLAVTAIAFVGLISACTATRAEEIGSVSTTWRLVGPNDRIVVDAFDDPKVQGVACHVARARTGGLSGAVGLAEDVARQSIACRQVGPITADIGSLPQQEEVFRQSTSILFKRVRVVRMIDRKRNTLIYVVYSDRLIDGSPENSISTVPVQTWR